MRMVILASGNGTNAQAVIDATADGRITGRVVGVVSDRSGAPVLGRARAAGVESVLVERAAGEPRPDFDSRLAAVVSSFAADVVVLAGWMRVLTMAFIGAVDVPVVNLHPALPGELPGVSAIERAWAERAFGRTRSGVMVHLVPDEGVDSGPVLGSVEVPLGPGDSLDDFRSRMHDAEHDLLVSVLSGMAAARTRPEEGAHA